MFQNLEEIILAIGPDDVEGHFFLLLFFSEILLFVKVELGQRCFGLGFSKFYIRY